MSLLAVAAAGALWIEIRQSFLPCWAQSREMHRQRLKATARHTQTPRRPIGAGGGEERAAQGSCPFTNALFALKVQCKVSNAAAGLGLQPDHLWTTDTQASCVPPTPQLKREQSLLAGFG